MASVKAGSHVTFLAELRSENGDHPEPYGVYVRIRPWTGRRFDVQIGRVPPTFGAFPRRSYAADNPLVSFPLAYQYLTSLRADALPANADELLRMRGRGWLSNYSVGDLAPDPGVPLVSAFRWDTGVQVHAGTDILDATASVTAARSRTRCVKDNNDGRAVAGRVAVHPNPGTRRRRLDREGSIRQPKRAGGRRRGPLRRLHPDGVGCRCGVFARLLSGACGSGRQRVEAAGGGSSGDREPAASRRDLRRRPLQVSTGVLRSRTDRSSGVQRNYTRTSTRAQWEAPLTRFTVGGGYSIQRNLLLKAEYQHNARSGGRVHHLDLAAAQVVFWF